MDDAEVRGIILQRAHDSHDKNNGYARISEIDFSGGDPVPIPQIMSAGRYLAESDFITWQPFSGGPGLADARIKAKGTDAIERPETRPSTIRIRLRAAIEDVATRGEVGDLSGRSAQFGRALPPFPLNQNSNADEVRRRTAEMANRTLAGGYIFDPLTPVDTPELRQARVSAAILKRPREIEAAVRHLAQEIRLQLAEMQASKPNDHDALLRHNDFTEFLEKSAARLDQVAEIIHGVSGDENNPQDGILTKEATQALSQLGTEFKEWWERNGDRLPGRLVRLGLISAGAFLLHSFDLGYLIEAGVASLACEALIGIKKKKE